MKNNRPFVPGFLKKFNDYLLLNKPDSWSAREHLVVYYGLLFMIVLAGICFLAPYDPRANSTIYVCGFFVGILSSIGFIVWLIYLLSSALIKKCCNKNGAFNSRLPTKGAILWLVW